MNAVEFKNVYFSYEDNSLSPLFSHLNLSIPKGKYTVLLGHNGSGKSTVAKLFIGLLEAKSGDILIDGEKLTEKSVETIRNKVAIVFQNPDNQFIGATVEDDIAFGLENRCVPQEKMMDIIVEFASKVGMQDYLKAEPSQLSGGQKQRVAIAGALAMNPEILVLDEATSMLDPNGRQDIRSLINSVKEKNENMTIIAITHHIEEALNADNIIILNNGQVAANGKPEDILYDKKILDENSLVAPFVVNLTMKLQSEGIDIDKSFSIDELVEKL